MNPRYFSFIGLIGIIIFIYSGGSNYNSVNGSVDISLSLASVLSWPLYLISAFSINKQTDTFNGKPAPWWQKSISFIYDFFWLLGLLFIPFTFLAFYLHTGHFQQPWSLENSYSKFIIIENLAFLLVFLTFWISMGFFLNPKVQSPGMNLANINISIEENSLTLKQAGLGLIAYYGVFFPLFKFFAPGLKVNGICRS